MSSLGDLRARVEAGRTDGGLGLAAALIALAEAEPALAHRTEPVRALLVEAAGLLDREDSPPLQGRVLLRMGHLKMVEGDLEGAEQMLARAESLLERAGDAAGVVELRSERCRVLTRRTRLDEARDGLVRLSEELARVPAGAGKERAAVALALGIGELSLQGEERAGARSMFEDLLAGVAKDERLVEVAFTCRQSLVYLALQRGDPETAIKHLREMVALAKSSGALEDELEARIALAAALVDRGDLAGREEAAKHLQITRDSAQEAKLDSMHMAALVGQAGLMAQRGQTQGALDRCLEIARAAVEHKDPPRYVSAVALMAEIYQQNGDFPSAYKALAEAEAALLERFGEAGRQLIRPHLFALADKMGRNKFVAMVDNMNKARRALQDWERERDR